MRRREISLFARSRAETLTSFPRPNCNNNGQRRGLFLRGGRESIGRGDGIFLGPLLSLFALPQTQQYRCSNLSAFPCERGPPHLVLSSRASPARESRKGKGERAGRKRRPGNSSALSSPNWYIAREGTNCEFTHDSCRKIVLCPVFKKIFLRTCGLALVLTLW